MYNIQFQLNTSKCLSIMFRFLRNAKQESIVQPDNTTPQILFQLNEHSALNPEDLFKISENNNLSFMNGRLAAELYINDQSIFLGSIKFVKETDCTPNKYIINVSTNYYLWNMGIATMLLSLLLCYWFVQNQKKDFILYADPMMTAMELYTRENPVFIYHNFIKQLPDFNSAPPKEQLYCKRLRKTDNKNMQSLFISRKEYLITHYKQIVARNGNPLLCEKGAKEIESICPEILEL